MWVIFFFCVFFMDSIAVETIPKSSASLNNIIDQITKNINTNGKTIGLDSFSLPDIYKETKGVGNTKIFNLTNGIIYNLTSIERHGTSTISYNSKVLEVILGFHFLGLQVNYDFDIHAWGLNPTGKLKGLLSDFRIDAEGNVDLNNFNANIKKLKIPTTGNIDFSINTQVPIYGYIVEDLIAGLKPFQDIIIYEIGNQLTKKINEILKNIFK